ncbi:MAG: hypothetical protein GX962_03275 [Epulopiscium sp.]|nr:hypothetical protein [Candidatus Epulonipiscium sp.]
MDTQSDDEDSHNNIGIYLKRDRLNDEGDFSYSQSYSFTICAEDQNEEKAIGELKGHFFDLKSLNINQRLYKSHPIIQVLNQYDEETFDICQNLCKETNCARGRGQNIFHLDRFFIQEKYRGHGTGRTALYQFQTQATYLLEHDVRYIALFPDPITEDLEFDSLYDMDMEKRADQIKKLKTFYGSLGFKEMKRKPSYMYVDLHHMKERSQERVLSQ